MLLGLDVGGTHTDVVILDEKGLVNSAKVVTNHENLLESVDDGISRVLDGIDKSRVTRINLSTTLSTNAIVEGKNDRVAVIVSAGPGIEPDNFSIGDFYLKSTGSLDHRGTEIQPIDEKRLDGIAKELTRSGVKTAAVISKFSTRNPSHEIHIKEKIHEQMEFITLGHTLSGMLNFPRRIVTAYYNSAVWRLYSAFAGAIETTVKAQGIEAGINILKADGGTMPVSLSKMIPVETILSGPAASVMGIIALCDITADSIILDIGGTTTDIAVFASGAPLIEPFGIDISGRYTLVRALKTRSIGIGGDSRIDVHEGKITAGPEREGPSLADGGKAATLIDACNFKGIMPHGDSEASRKGIVALALRNGMEPGVLADTAIAYAAEKIRAEVGLLVEEINNKPVYTIHELIEGKKVLPEKIYLMGGPAKTFSGILSHVFGMKVEVPAKYDVANAIGAALARTTLYLDVLADTEKRRLIIPDIQVNIAIPSGYSREEAERDAKKYLMEYVRKQGVSDKYIHAEIVESSSYNMIQGFSTTGRNIRVKCQVKPGILQEYNDVVRNLC